MTPLSTIAHPEKGTTLRTHTCGELTIQDTGKDVIICGWVQTVRDFGKFCFVDLRDRHGITQISVKADETPELYQIASGLGREWVLGVQGTVVERENKNPKLNTGDIEIKPKTLEVLNQAALPPFKIEDETDGGEDLRLAYRYLDIRRPKVAQNLVLRAKMVRAMRSFLDSMGFLEIETPNLIKSTPEGARDFIVPSRLQPGSFYALPQSPQLLKQLLMVAGMDRYYQICKCYRDEDFRGDRQPEFTQVDCEMSFVTQQDILSMFGRFVQYVFKEVKGIDLGEVPSITWHEAMHKYGSDKPDLRFGMPIVELNAVVNQTAFPVFAQALETKGLVAGIVAKGCAAYTRKQTDALTDFVKEPHRGCKGLVLVRVTDEGIKSSADKFLDPAQLQAIVDATKAEIGDLVLIVADKATKVRKTLGDLRLEIAKRENLIDPNSWSVFFVIDFPLFEEDEETGALTPAHHPFVMPNPDDYHLIDSEPAKVRALCYDMVMNGNEIMSGSIRIHRRDIQEKIFDILGLTEAEKEEKFGFLLKAFEYGAPPHGGCAFGLDRWVMLFAGGETIRDVIAFPKNSAGRDMMLDAPAPVDADALKTVGIRVLENNPAN